MMSYGTRRVPLLGFWGLASARGFIFYLFPAGCLLAPWPLDGSSSSEFFSGGEAYGLVWSYSFLKNPLSP